MATAPHAAASQPVWKKLWHHPFTVMFVAGGLFVFVWLGFAIAMLRWQTGLPTTADMLLREAIPVLACIATYKLLIIRLGRFRKDDLQLSGATGDMAFGLVSGGALVSAVVGIAILAGVYGIAGEGGTGDALEILVVAGLSAAVIEEILLRGILFRWIEEAAGSLFALLATSALVAGAHAFYLGATPVSIATQAVVFGLLMGAAYMLTRSLWLPIGLHMGWNVTLALGWGEPVSGIQYQGLVISEFGGPDWLTGGAWGLGNSAIALAIGAMFAGWAIRTAHRQGHWLPIGWRRSLSNAK